MLRQKKEIPKEEFIGGYTDVPVQSGPFYLDPNPEPEPKLEPIKHKSPPSNAMSKFKKHAFTLFIAVMIMNLIFYEPFVFSRIQKVGLSFIMAFIFLLVDFFYN
jgi:hypothetical protein